MSTHTATITWTRNHEKFTDNRYSRAHQWSFDGGLQVDASSSPQVVPLPMSVEEAVDPEEAFVASLSSCHMLWFLSIAAKAGFCVESYRDEAVGVMAKNEAGKWAMTEVTLRPQVIFAIQPLPTAEQIEQLHHRAHQECYLANSVRTAVRIVPQAN